MSRSIAVFGGSFNPPGVHHRAIAELLAARFDLVRIVPCGPRPDKPVTNDVSPVHRATMAEYTFRGLDRVELDLFDLENETFTRTWQMEERFAGDGEIWHVVGTDLLAGGATGQSVIQREWARGKKIWNELRFIVVQRPPDTLDPDDLPPHSVVFETVADGASSTIRDRIFKGQAIDGMVIPQVAAYIERHHLYRGMPPPRSTRLQFGNLRPLVVFDPWNEHAKNLAGDLHPLEQQDPNIIVVIGGDGTMLRAIRSEWKRRIPFYGISTGQLGFLLNSRPPWDLPDRHVVLEQLPLLKVETEHTDGRIVTALSFNDAWVERTTGQTAWLQVKVNDEVRLERLVADGALVATAAGSSAYARAMGAHPIPLNTPALLLVGSNVLQPAFWKPAVLPLDSCVEINTLDKDKRPLRGYIDGVDQGDVVRMRCGVSRIAAVELAFDPGTDPAEKLARIQFPLNRE